MDRRRQPGDLQLLTAQQFYDAGGVEDWRALWGAGYVATHFRTVSFAAGVDLVRAIGERAEAADHHPDVDLRYGGVTVSLFSHDVGGLTMRDVRLAREISAVAHAMNVAADPSVVQHVQVAIDAVATDDVRRFWQAVLGYPEVGDADLLDPRRRGPTFWFQQMDEPRPQRNRIHIDIYVPYDEVEARIAAALAAGGRIVNDGHAPQWWTLADPEGNEVDLAIWG